MLLLNFYIYMHSQTLIIRTLIVTIFFLVKTQVTQAHCVRHVGIKI